jgi:hypothetical protein
MVMTMKLTYLTTYWNAADAETVVTFLDELREVILAVYGEQIQQMHRAIIENRSASQIERQLDFADVDDDF